MNGITFAHAAKSGDLTILDWLREYCCPYSIQVASAAARKGYIHVLEWLKDNGYEYKENICNIAFIDENRELMEWAIKNGCKKFSLANYDDIPDLVDESD